MTALRKPRSDSKFASLPREAQSLLQQKLDHQPYDQIIHWLQKDYGLAVTRSNLSRYRSRVKASELIQQSMLQAATLQRRLELMEEGDPNNALLICAMQRHMELQAIEQEDFQAYVSVLRLHNQSRLLTLREIELARQVDPEAAEEDLPEPLQQPQPASRAASPKAPESPAAHASSDKSSVPAGVPQDFLAFIQLLRALASNPPNPSASSSHPEAQLMAAALTDSSVPPPPPALANFLAALLARQADSQSPTPDPQSPMTDPRLAATTRNLPAFSENAPVSNGVVAGRSTGSCPSQD